MAHTGQEIYDLDFDFHMDGDGDLILIEGPAVVRKSVENVVMTALGGRRKDPKFGTRISQMIMNRYDIFLGIALQREIYLAILNEEPRVKEVIPRVIPDRSNQVVSVYVTYLLISTGEQVTFDVLLDKLR